MVRRLRLRAADWRRDQPDTPAGGWVIVYGGKACGWTAELVKPEDWQPGCYAVPPVGTIWKAIGGNDEIGASTWSPFFEQPALRLHEPAH